MTALPVVILGAGPAGLAAAEAASRDGRAVVMVDDNPDAGGQIWRGGVQQWSDRRAGSLWASLKARPHVRMLFGTRLVAASRPGMLLLDSAGHALELPWEQLVLCTGARELLLPFPGWTLPGVTGAGGLQALIKGGVPVGGKRVLIAGSGPLLLAVADTVRRNGGDVIAIAERRNGAQLARFAMALARRHPAKLLQAARLRMDLLRTPYIPGATVVEAMGTRQLEKVRLATGGEVREIACDFLACGYGLVPAVEVARQFECLTAEGRVLVDHRQRTSVNNIWAAGESTGIGGVDKALAEGVIAGLDAAGGVSSRADRNALAKASGFARLLAASFAPDKGLRDMCTPETIVCRCEDVRAQELKVFSDWRSAKLQTRAGMGACQGRVCGAACEFLYGWEGAGTRSPVFPVPAEVLASWAPYSEQ